MAAKRSLFKKPAWAAQSKAQATDDGKSIFQQNVYEDILRENQKKEERRLAKQKQKAEQNNTTRPAELDDAKQPNKKRRTSVDAYVIDTDDDDANDDERKFADGYESSSHSDMADNATRPKTRSKNSRQLSLSREATPTELEGSPKRRRSEKADSHDAPQTSSRSTQPDSDDDLIVIEEVSAKPSPRKSKPKPKKPVVPESESDSETDPYVRELKRTARAEARLKKLQAVQDQVARENNIRSPSTGPPGSSHTLDSDRNSNTPTPLTISSTDPEVLIRIKTIIPGCNEIFVKRKASQTLEGLEKYFVETHKLSDMLRQKVFFTWNLQKLYKSTTMSSILAQIKAKHGTNSDGSDRSEGRIELEAMTVEILDLRRQQLEREKKIASGEWQEDGQNQGDQGTDDPAVPVEAAEPVQQRKGIVIHLKSNDERTLPSMALRVHPDTAVSKIIRGYKSKMKIDPFMKIYLMFDGDRLEGEQVVADVGFEDEDCVDIGAD